MTRRLRYVCGAEGCDEHRVTPRGHAAHANRDHGDRAIGCDRRWVEVDD